MEKVIQNMRTNCGLWRCMLTLSLTSTSSTSQQLLLRAKCQRKFELYVDLNSSKSSSRHITEVARQTDPIEEVFYALSDDTTFMN